MEIRCLSLNYSVANSSVKDKLAMSKHEVLDVSSCIKDLFPVEEVFTFSTCNRTELYIASEGDVLFCLKIWLFERYGISEAEVGNLQVDEFSSTKETINHLFLVGVGAKSQVLGDIQVIHQVKESYKFLAAEGLVGAFLHRALHHLFHVSKRVSAETTFHKGASSVASSAVQLVNELVQADLGASILLIGAGKNGEDTLKNLISLGYHSITIVNRTQSKAHSLAIKYNVNMANYNDLPSLIAKHDVVLTSVQSTNFIIDENTVLNLKESYRYKYFLDLSVPSVIDASIECNPALLLYGLSYMTERNEVVLKERLEALRYVDQILAEEVLAYQGWRDQFVISNKARSVLGGLSLMTEHAIIDAVKDLTIHLCKELDQSVDAALEKSLQLLKVECQRQEGLDESMVELFTIHDEHKQIVVNDLMYQIPQTTRINL